MRGEPRRILGEHPGDDGLRARAGKRRLACQHLIGHRTKRVDVGSVVDGSLPGGLLRRHVVRGSQREPRLRHPVAAGLLHRQGDPEIGDQRAAVVEQDVLRLDVAMYHTMLVGVLQGVGYLAGDAHRFGHRQLLLSLEPAPECLAIHKWHDIVEEAVDFTGIEERKHVGVLQVGGELDFLQEALGAEHCRELGVEHFECDIAAVPKVACEIHRGHAAPAELTLDDVPAAQSGVQPVCGAGHVLSPRAESTLVTGLPGRARFNVSRTRKERQSRRISPSESQENDLARYCPFGGRIWLDGV